MDIIPKLIAGIFLFRTLKNPIYRITEIIQESPSPLLVLSFFLLGELGIVGLFKLFPLFLYLHFEYHPLPTIKKWQLSDVQKYLNQLRDIDHFTSILTPIIAATAFLTGWFVRDPQAIHSLPINSFLTHSTSSPLWVIFICVSIGYSLKFTKKILLLSQLAYLSLFFSVEHLSFLFLFIFVIVGLLTKRDQDKTPFLSFYIIEACLTVGTLFTTAPANILFAIGSITLVWRLSKLNDKFKKQSPIPGPIPCAHIISIPLPTLETAMPTRANTSEHK